ncbi:MAG: OmpA family protein [Saprospiraceae bacterium]|nr:OmpA family protein [Saprospiraceae bacterium]
MKTNQRNLLRLALFMILLSMTGIIWAQPTTSKSKSSDKLYEKGELNPNIAIRNSVLINTEHLDFSPAFYQNGIVYVSSRYQNGPIDKKIGETFFELFYAELDKEGNPLEPQDFSVNVNSQTHEGPVTFNKAGNRIYFTRNNMHKGVRQADSRDVTRLKIYEAEKGVFDWENVRELPFNSDEYSCMHPSLSADGRRLYFSSDMPGGYGGYDLYVVEKVGDSWTQPLNLGQEVNTTQNEVFPFIHDSGMLFFSSDGHEGYGGLDIFMINVSGQSWSKVFNLGMPLNSARSDLGFILNPEGTMGFFASDRAGGYGKDDIYRIILPEGLKGINSVLELPSKLIVFNSETNERIPTASVRAFERSADGFIEGNEFYDVHLVPASNGSDELEIKLVRKQASELGDPQLYTDTNGEAVSRLKAEKSYVLLVEKDGFEMGEVLYSTVGETGPQTIRIPMRPQSCVLLSGIVSIQNYESPVPNATIRIINECTNDVTVVESNASGEFQACLPFGCNFTIQAEKQGYTKGANKVSTETGTMAQSPSLNVNLQLNPVADNFLREPIKEGTVIVLENIYYDFNKSAIRRGAARELDALVNLMNIYPSMEIEMIAYTDSRGTDDYNMELSLKRAESAKRYLESQGVSGNRVKAFGYGESKLRNGCKDGVECSEEQHQYNRRTEVRVSKMAENVKVKYESSDPFGN